MAYDDMPLVGGKYRLGRVLGKGAFGEVRIGRNMETYEWVAVKMVMKNALSDENMLDQLINELAVMENLDHKNVVRLYDTFETEAHECVVMELANDGTLYDYVATRLDDDDENGDAVKAYLEEAEAREFFVQVLEAVSHMHSKDVCHRDLKLENIFLSHGGQIKVGDFGLAKFMDGGRFLEGGCGSPHYAAPEVVLHGRYDGRKADIWSLGIVLYVMLFGCFPFTECRYRCDPSRPDELEKFYEYTMGARLLFPRRISFSAEHLLRQMLDPYASTRSSLALVMSNPWLRSAIKKTPKPTPPLISANHSKKISIMATTATPPSASQLSQAGSVSPYEADHSPSLAAYPFPQTQDVTPTLTASQSSFPSMPSKYAIESKTFDGVFQDGQSSLSITTTSPTTPGEHCLQHNEDNQSDLACDSAPITYGQSATNEHGRTDMPATWMPTPPRQLNVTDTSPMASTSRMAPSYPPYTTHPSSLTPVAAENGTWAHPVDTYSPPTPAAQYHNLDRRMPNMRLLELLQAMEDVMAKYDGTVRNALGDVIQFLYGADGMDGVKVEKQALEFMLRSQMGRFEDFSRLFTTVSDNHSELLARLSDPAPRANTITTLSTIIAPEQQTQTLLETLEPILSEIRARLTITLPRSPSPSPPYLTTFDRLSSQMMMGMNHKLVRVTKLMEHCVDMWGGNVWKFEGRVENVEHGVGSIFTDGFDNELLLPGNLIRLITYALHQFNLSNNHTLDAGSRIQELSTLDVEGSSPETALVLWEGREWEITESPVILWGVEGDERCWEFWDAEGVAAEDEQQINDLCAQYFNCEDAGAPLSESMDGLSASVPEIEDFDAEDFLDQFYLNRASTSSPTSTIPSLIEFGTTPSSPTPPCNRSDSGVEVSDDKASDLGTRCVSSEPPLPMQRLPQALLSPVDPQDAHELPRKGANLKAPSRVRLELHGHEQPEEASEGVPCCAERGWSESAVRMELHGIEQPEEASEGVPCCAEWGWDESAVRMELHSHEQPEEASEGGEEEREQDSDSVVEFNPLYFGPRVPVPPTALPVFTADGVGAAPAAAKKEKKKKGVVRRVWKGCKRTIKKMFGACVGRGVVEVGDVSVVGTAVVA
ncbi:hypothetical protein HDV00_009077 [Rhizophlyctis rosea]|nr:hypothetical protein HDV00_009077 [Rhizophlyctis rosea]